MFNRLGQVGAHPMNVALRRRSAATISPHRCHSPRLPIGALTLALSGAALLASPPALADERRPTEQQIIQRLTLPPPKPLTRSLTRNLKVEEVPPPKIDLEVNFEFNSADLTGDARSVLDSLGRALQHPQLAGARIRIAGHTDGKGSDEYNLKLSERRAAAVAEYLVRQHRLEAIRLAVEGHGKRKLLFPSQPDNPLNRRVEVANLGEKKQ